MSRLRDSDILFSRHLSSHKFLHTSPWHSSRNSRAKKAQTEKFAEVDAVLRDIAFRHEQAVDSVQNPAFESISISTPITEAVRAKPNKDSMSQEIKALSVIKLKLHSTNSVLETDASSCNNISVIKKTSSLAEEATKSVACVLPYSSEDDKYRLIESMDYIFRPIPPSSDCNQRQPSWQNISLQQQSNATEAEQLDHLLKLRAFRKNLEQEFNLKHS